MTAWTSKINNDPDEERGFYAIIITFVVSIRKMQVYIHIFIISGTRNIARHAWEGARHFVARKQN